MKNTGRKLLCMLLALVFVMSLLPLGATAFAEDVIEAEEEPAAPQEAETAYALWLGETQVTSANAGDILGDGSAKYDAAAKTLTLTKPAIPGLHGGAQIYAELKNLTIAGSAELTNPDAETGIWLGADAADSAMLTLSGNFAVSGSRWGVYSQGGVSVTAGKITVTGGQRGITANGSVRVRGTMQAQPNLIVKATEEDSVGLYTYKELTVSLASLSAEGKALGVKAEKDVTVEPYSSVTIKGENGGLNTDETLRVTGGVVKAESDKGEGIRAKAISVSGTTEKVEATGAVRGIAASAAGSITIGGDYSVKAPENGLVVNGGDALTVTEADGTTAAGHVIIAPTVVNFTVSFLLDGVAQADLAQSVIENGTATEPELTLSEGKLNGWYTDADCTEKYDFSTPVTDNLTLYAQTLFTVTFNANGGSGSMEPLEAPKGVATPLPACSFKAPEGSRFKEWDTLAGGDGTSYLDKQNVTPPSDLELFAQWEKVPTFTVTFDTDGGSEIAPVTVAEGDVVEMPEEPTKDGYLFDKWTLDGEPYDFDTPVDADITLKATWTKAASFTVKFDSAGGTSVPSQTVNEGGFVKKPKDPTRAGYEFGGWQLGGKAFDFSKPVTADMATDGTITLKAKWTAIAYNIFPGGNITYGKKGGRDLEIVVKRSVRDDTCYDHFEGVEIDGKLLTPGSDYTARAGSTVVTLKASKVKALTLGKHTLTILFDDGEAETGLFVQLAYVAPRTGDSGSPLLWAALTVLSGTGAAALLLVRRRRRTE